MALIEFKNLPDTSTPLNAENLNNNFNELNDSIEELKESNVYSEEEQVIGIWLNGKPLYRKIYSGKAPDLMNTVAYLNNINMIYVRGWLALPTGTQQMVGGYIDNVNYSDVVLSAENELKLYVSSAWRNSSYNLILEYTKTTD